MGLLGKRPNPKQKGVFRDGENERAAPGLSEIAASVCRTLAAGSVRRTSTEPRVMPLVIAGLCARPRPGARPPKICEKKSSPARVGTLDMRKNSTVAKRNVCRVPGLPTGRLVLGKRGNAEAPRKQALTPPPPAAP